MDNRPPIERVRDREHDGPEIFEDARDTYRQKEAKLNQQAAEDAPEQQPEEEFEEQMREKLKESGKDKDSH